LIVKVHWHQLNIETRKSNVKKGSLAALVRSSTQFRAGMARCAIRPAFSSGAILRLARIPAPSFRRLTLRSATGKSQRDFPAKIKNRVQTHLPL